MTVPSSNLSDPKYGYDFVVATTQASINSGLKKNLGEGTQPVDYICFIADATTGNVHTQIPLEELITKTGGVNPFDIPAGTPYDDPRITTLTKNMFIAGIKIQMGVPPGVLPNALPPVVTLGTSADNVLFNMFCSQFEVIQNTPPGGFSNHGAWDVWSQPSGTPWYVTTKVNLVAKDLDNNLDTPYFNNHPIQQAALRLKLKSMSGSSFSLQQLLIDLDSAVMETVPSFVGIPKGSNAEAILQKAFIGIYSVHAKKHGEPLISVKAVSPTPDKETLRMTGFEREVHPLVDGKGVAIANPTSAQKNVTTLDYLCAVNNNPLPGAATFNWNWVTPEQVDDESGVIAVNRHVIAKHLMDQILVYAKNNCFKSTTSVDAKAFGSVDYKFSLLHRQTPQTIEVTPSGETVAKIEYACTSHAYNKCWATAGTLDINPNYTCYIKFSGNTITITQRLWVYTYVKWDNTGQGFNAVDKTITDTYTLSIGQNGGLEISPPVSNPVDNSQSPSAGWAAEFFTKINDVANSIKAQIKDVVSVQLTDIPLNDLQNFVFPGGGAFTYKSVSFSDHQDLISEITYV